MEPVTQSIFEQEQRPTFYADPGKRFLNFLLDLIVYYAGTFVMGIILGLIWGVTSPDTLYMLDDNTGWGNLIWIFVSMFTYLGVYTLMEGTTKGKSLGKLVTKTRAVKEDGSPITWGDAFKRSLCRLIPFEVFSGFSRKPWHDGLTNTKVIEES